jgi:ABC-2 type transport system permease protein
LVVTPVGWLVLAAFASGVAVLFVGRLEAGQVAQLRGTLRGVVWLMVFVVPAVSMRLIAEERRTGTMERLVSLPVGSAAVVLGKWLGAVGYLGLLLLPVVLCAVVLEVFADPQLGPVATGLLGLVLVGALFLAVGLCASAATDNQVVAFVATVFVIGLPTLGLTLLRDATWVTPGWGRVLDYLHVNSQFEEFNKGLIDLRNVVYFVSLTGLFLFLAVRVLEARRWR